MLIAKILFTICLVFLAVSDYNEAEKLKRQHRDGLFVVYFAAVLLLSAVALETWGVFAFAGKYLF